MKKNALKLRYLKSNFLSNHYANFAPNIYDSIESSIEDSIFSNIMIVLMTNTWQILFQAETSTRTRCHSNMKR